MFTNQEILTKAIQKAIDGGWDFDGLLAPMDPGRYEVIAPFGGDYLIVKTINWSGEESFDSINSVIYSKNFAKALWGEAMTTDKLWQKRDEPLGNKPPLLLHVMPAYEYHLQQMVIAEDPIKYLGENI